MLLSGQTHELKKGTAVSNLKFWEERSMGKLIFMKEKKNSTVDKTG